MKLTRRAIMGCNEESKGTRDGGLWGTGDYHIKYLDK